MIVPMRKYSLISFHGDYDRLLKGLQSLGIVHVVEKEGLGEGDEVRDLSSLATRLSRALKTLKQKLPELEIEPRQSSEAGEILESLDRIQQETERLNQESALLTKEVALLTPWGEFSNESLARLGEVGIEVKTYLISEKKFDRSWLGEYPLAIVGQQGSRLCLAAFLKAGEELSELGGLEGLEEVRLPARGLAEALARRDENAKEREALRAELVALAGGNSVDLLETELKRVLTEMDLVKAELSGESQVEDRVRILQGWAPRKTEPELLKMCDELGVVAFGEDPTPEDQVPIQLKNSRFARLFEPITRMFSLPSYAELDLTPLFAPFFALFFGFCVGDAGYGAVLIIATLIARFFVKPSLKPLMTLATIFGFTTLLVGSLTGSLFGLELVTIPELKEYILIQDQNVLFNLALAIGLLQIIFGMCVQVVNRWKQYGFWASVSTMGWIVLVLSLLGLAGEDLLGSEVAEISGILIFVGIGLILLFNDLKANIFVRIGKGVWELYGITGLFGDILSYVRLFALGISSGILGAVINQITGQFEAIPLIGPVVYILALVIGHTGNMLLAMLGAFVHPMRLTFVEFYNNAGFSGGGKEYKPLAVKK